MKKFAALAVFLLLLTLPFLFATRVFATSQQAYQDYLYQFDVYRQKYNDFQVAKNAYDKFQTLESQTSALSATKSMLSQRDLLIHTYLVYLDERMGEQGGITQVDKGLYQTLLNNELVFLEAQSSLVSSINSIDDAVTTSQQLEGHYRVLSQTIRQIIAGISLGQLSVIAQNFDIQMATAQSLFAQNSVSMSADKISTINNWVLNITNKRSLYQQKITEISSAVTNLTNSNDSTDLDQKFQDITSKIGQARQYLADCIANLGELANALAYVN